MSNKDVATKYGVTRNTVSTWVKNKHKLTASLEKKGMNSSRKNTRCGNYEKVDKAIYNWFVRKRSQKIPIDGIIIKEKALGFAKALGLSVPWVYKNRDLSDEGTSRGFETKPFD